MEKVHTKISMIFIRIINKRNIFFKPNIKLNIILRKYLFYCYQLFVCNLYITTIYAELLFYKLSTWCILNLFIVYSLVNLLYTINILQYFLKYLTI